MSFAKKNTPRKSTTQKSTTRKTTSTARTAKAAAKKKTATQARKSSVKKARPARAKTAYFNRELSWLAFNRRVLEQAQSKRAPLLERLRFLCFVCSNLDEFFEIRVAGLIQQVQSGVVDVGKDGLGPKELLRRITDVTNQLVKDKYACWNKQLLPELRKEGIHFKSHKELNAKEKKWVAQYFENEVYPVLTPLAIDPAHPFPQLVNKSLNILAQISDPKRRGSKNMAIIPVPRILPRVIEVEAGENSTYIFLHEIIKAHADKLFPGFRIKTTSAFRITRNSDLYIDEEEVENLLHKIEEELHKLRRGDAVRLEIEANIPQPLLKFLLDATELRPEYVYRIDGPINIMRLMPVYDLIHREDLKFEPFKAHIPKDLDPTENIFDTISKKDHLLHHPYDSFAPVVDFVMQAAHDPKVFAIKQTLYRTSGDSPIIAALKEASRNGKQVTALVELKARFDELNNIQWARELEENGVHVVYGLVGLKTHCKCSLVVRRESNGLMRYAHLGTGNYNPKTAKSYTDLSFFTSNESITQEVADLFNTLTGFARSPNFKKLLVAPFSLHSSMQKLILNEAANAKAGKPARIIAKVNSLIDHETIDNLYKASNAGVQIDLIVRGICGLVPGVKGMSENIRVRSILGRFLEHSRIFYFENGNDESKLYAGSADWMQRNFFRRIEAIYPIESPELRDYVINTVLPFQLADNTNAKELQPDGSYTPVKRTAGTNAFSAQDYILKNKYKL